MVWSGWGFLVKYYQWRELVISQPLITSFKQVKLELRVRSRMLHSPKILLIVQYQALCLLLNPLPQALVSNIHFLLTLSKHFHFTCICLFYEILKFSVLEAPPHNNLGMHAIVWTLLVGSMWNFSSIGNSVFFFFFFPNPFMDELNDK